MSEDNILKNLVRIGIVTAVDKERRLARVKYPDTGNTSGWLAVLANRTYIPDYDEKPQRTEYAGGGAGLAAFESHSHELNIKPWLPKVNAQVLVLYLPVNGGDGFILGEIMRWK